MNAILGLDLPALAPGAVWLVTASPEPLSPLVLHAMRQADIAVIDAAILPALTGRVPPTCSLEPAPEHGAAAAARAGALARAGWRVVRVLLDDGEAQRRTVGEAALLQEASAPFRIVLLIEASAAAHCRPAAHPLGFSLSGLAG